MARMDYLHDVADAYDMAPVFVAGDIPAWDALRTETLALAAGIERALTVVYTPFPGAGIAGPYNGLDELCGDIASGHVVISTANSEHPLWSREDNRAFRLVHDVIGHAGYNWHAQGVPGPRVGTPAGFTWTGELQAYSRQWTYHTPLARMALFTEVVGQLAWRLVHGHFPVQKVATLPQWMQWATETDEVPSVARAA